MLSRILDACSGLTVTLTDIEFSVWWRKFFAIVSEARGFRALRARKQLPKSTPLTTYKRIIEIERCRCIRNWQGQLLHVHRRSVARQKRTRVHEIGRRERKQNRTERNKQKKKKRKKKWPARSESTRGKMLNRTARKGITAR